MFPHSPGRRNNDQALDVEDEEKDLPVSDQFEQPRLVDAAHSERYGETLQFDICKKIPFSSFRRKLCLAAAQDDAFLPGCPRGTASQWTRTPA